MNRSAFLTANVILVALMATWASAETDQNTVQNLTVLGWNGNYANTCSADAQIKLEIPPSPEEAKITSMDITKDPINGNARGIHVRVAQPIPFDGNMITELDFVRTEKGFAPTEIKSTLTPGVDVQAADSPVGRNLKKGETVKFHIVKNGMLVDFTTQTEMGVKAPPILRCP